MYFIISTALLIILEFIIEPFFRIRKRIIDKLGGHPTVISVFIIIVFIITANIYYLLINQFSSIDQRIFAFSCITILIYFIPKKYDNANI